MAACKDDSQQRSWALHEDESVITEYLQELISILVRLILFPTLQHFRNRYRYGSDNVILQSRTVIEYYLLKCN